MFCYLTGKQLQKIEKLQRRVLWKNRFLLVLNCWKIYQTKETKWLVEIICFNLNCCPDIWLVKSFSLYTCNIIVKKRLLFNTIWLMHRYLVWELQMMLENYSDGKKSRRSEECCWAGSKRTRKNAWEGTKRSMKNGRLSLRLRIHWIYMQKWKSKMLNVWKLWQERMLLSRSWGRNWRTLTWNLQMIWRNKTRI